MIKSFKNITSRAGVKPVLTHCSDDINRYTIEIIAQVKANDTGGINTMSKLPKDQHPSHEKPGDEVDEVEYAEMDLLERLETLREDMEELGVTTLAEVIQRIEELHRRLDTKE